MKKLLAMGIIVLGCTSCGKNTQPVEVHTQTDSIEWVQTTEELTNIEQISIDTRDDVNTEELTTEAIAEIDVVCENKYVITAYTDTGNPMANGEMPYVGACACNSLPFGTVVHIEGMGDYVVCDRGGMADNVIDVYMETYEECIEFGRQTRTVSID